MLSDAKIAQLIQVFSSTATFPHSSVLPRRVLSSTHRGSCLEDSSDEAITTFFESLTNEHAKGRFVARWDWWRFKDQACQNYLERQFAGSERVEDDDEQRNPDYYKAYWAELAELVNTHWQELQPDMIGFHSSRFDSSFSLQKPKKYTDFVRSFFAEKQHALATKKDELTEVAKAAARETLAQQNAHQNQTASSDTSATGISETLSKARAKAGRQKATIKDKHDRRAIRAEFLYLTQKTGLSKQAAYKELISQIINGRAGKAKLQEHYVSSELNEGKIRRIVASNG